MTDVELNALAILANAEAGAMKTENHFRLRDGYAPAYPDGAVLSLDSVRALDAELRRRGVVRSPEVKP